MPHASPSPRFHTRPLLSALCCLAAAFAAAEPPALLPGAGGPGSPIRAIAGEVIVAESDNPDSVALYTPSIVALGDRRLVATYTYTNRRRRSGHTVIVTSDDHGATWTPRATSPTNQGRLFTAGNTLYYLATRFYARPGNNPNGEPLCIQRSDDGGITWSDPIDLDNRTWHQTAANVWRANGCVYLVMERHIINNIEGWKVGALAPVLMRAPESADLTDPSAWTYSSELTFQDIIPGYRENDLQIDFFGIPYHPQSFPRPTRLQPRGAFSPMGWLESNVVQVVDPAHQWYDPEGRTFHLLMRAHTGMTNYGALAKVVENPDGSMTTSLQEVPSGKKLLYLPIPGGQSTDSMVRTDRMHDDRIPRGDQERTRLVLHFSRNLVDWCFAGVVAIGETPKSARHYACADFDGDDIVILSRSGDERAPNPHDGNLITFHRVSNFRDLVY